MKADERKTDEMEAGLKDDEFRGLVIFGATQQQNRNDCDRIMNTRRTSQTAFWGGYFGNMEEPVCAAGNLTSPAIALDAVRQLSRRTCSGYAVS